MLLKTPNHWTLTHPSECSDMVRLLSTILMAGMHRAGFIPYMPNEGDDTFWTLDSGNDWKVTFTP